MESFNQFFTGVEYKLHRANTDSEYRSVLLSAKEYIIETLSSSDELFPSSKYKAMLEQNVPRHVLLLIREESSFYKILLDS